MFRSGPSDPDLVARIKGGAILIRAVRSGLNGSRGLGATEGLLACGLVQKEEHDMSNPLECTGWLIEAQLWLAVKRGGSGRRCGVRSHLKGCYRLRSKTTRAQERGGPGDAHLAWKQPGMRRRGDSLVRYAAVMVRSTGRWRCR